MFGDLLAKFRTSQGLKAVLAVKLVVVLGVWISLDDRWTVGDLPARAEDTPARPEKKVESGTGSGTGSVAAAGKESGSEAASAPKEGAVRKSFLANLLELPELDPGSIQKEELGKYLEIAERKKRQIEERVDLLKRREDQLKGLEASIDDKLKKLEEERRFFSQTIQQEKDLKGERLEKLITMYAKMEPKKAAPIIEKLDKDLVVDLFKAMPQKQVTTILESMNPDKSVSISEYYGRVRSAREYDLLKEMNQSLRKEFDDCKGMPPVASTPAEVAPKTAR